MKVKLYGGTEHGKTVHVDPNMPIFLVLEMPPLDFRELRKDYKPLDPETHQYKIEKFAFQYGRIGWRELKVGVLDGYELTYEDLTEIRQVLVRTKLRYYTFSILEDFDEWFDMTCHKITGKTYRDHSPLCYP